MINREKILFSVLLLTCFLLSIWGFTSVTGKQIQNTRDALIPVTPPEAIRMPTTDNLRFEHISIEQGLSQSTVNAILQDQNGFLWFATQDGLNRYDGYDFEIYQSSPGDENSLSHNFILSLAEDQQGNIWIGTNGFGLDKFNPRKGTFEHYQQTKSDQYIRGRYILALYTSPDETLWAGTEDGLSRYDAKLNRFIDINAVNQHSDSGIISIFQDKAGMLWLGTHEEGPAMYNPQTDMFTFLNPLLPNSINTIQSVKSIIQEKNGDIWFATSQGVLIFNPQTEQFSDFPGSAEIREYLVEHKPKCLLQDQSGMIWIGTVNGGLILYNALDQSEFTIIPNPDQINGINNDSIMSMLEDQSGNLWFGSFSSGVNLLNRFAAPMEIYRSSAAAAYRLSDDLVWSIASDIYDNIWVGTNKGGINRINLNDQSIEVYSSTFGQPLSMNDEGVEALFFSSQNILWAGTSSGMLTRYDPLSGESRQYIIGRKIQSIYEDRDHQLWLGMEGNELIAFNPQTETMQSYDLILGDADEQTAWGAVYSIRQDAGNTLWIASNTGLYAMDLSTREITRHHLQLDIPTSSSSQTVLSILIKQDTLWLGTFGEGLIAYHPKSEKFQRYTMQDGLPNNVIYGILDDEYGRLWLSTNKGLSCFEPKSKSFVNYEVSDGLQSSEFNSGAYAKGQNGDLLFGGIDGLNRFYPQRFRKNPNIPPIVLTELTINGQSMLSEMDINNEPIVLEWPNNNFEFEFVALNYIQSQDNQYAYKLEKVDEDWVYIGNRRYGQFTNLPGGTYTLRLKGSNNDNIWNESGLAIQIEVIPPFWQTRWFISLMVLMTVSMIVGFYKLRMRSIHASNLRLESEVQERTSELMQTNVRLKQEIYEREKAETELSAKAAEAAVTNERNRLARELHDAVTQSLYGVNLYAEAAARMLAAGKLSPTAENICELQKSAREALQEMRLLIYELRPSMLVKGGLLLALENRLESVEKRVGIVSDFKHNLNHRLPAQYELSLYRIAQESLNNILKHAQATLILIRLWDHKDRVSLKIQDNGIGFNPMPTVYNGGMGLKIMKERAEHLGGEFQVKSSPGKGTTILVEVLYDKAHSIVDNG
ncbi:MAG: hypothetical protein JEZ00_14255 [Anaerolineaceae bacterium]|nr:hypothetical protein [Anaerolineaceae bacterium]